ncbi:hypothetical protein [Streptomyces sp. NPDC006368]|uniref:hypothetical protein n=1 Tax=Streptomyces sp. NPDC006368 TaxID=3156760 RepID=UPI0033B3FF7F
MRTVRERLRGGAALAGVAVAAALVSGCGIRPTVPVDAGAAPSRLPCSLSGDEAAPRAQEDVPVRVYLVCASGLEAVERAVGAAAAEKGRHSRVEVARLLLGQLGAEPTAREREAGFTTYVQSPLTVSAGREGDPAQALRLGLQPEDLAPAALSQIVCTYAEHAATTAGERTVLLGGPGDYPVRRYVCTRELKERPESPAPTESP